MARYKLMRKKNRLNAEKDGKWYAGALPRPLCFFFPAYVLFLSIEGKKKLPKRKLAV